MRITRVGVGTAPIGPTRNWSIYWGRQKEEDGVNAIRRALDLGVNWIDTAPFYGWGRAEKIVAKALKGRRDDVFIFTKCGTLPRGEGGSHMDLRPASIRREIDASLRNLETDHVDLYQMHDVDPATPVEESWKEIQAQIREGKVRYAGLSNHPIELVERAMRVGPVTSLQERYNPFYREAEEKIFPFVRRNRIGLLGWGSLAEGFLTDGFAIEKLDRADFRRKGFPLARRGNYEKVERVRRSLIEIASGHGRSLVDLVIAWELSHRELTGAIVGVRNPEEASGMVEAATWSLTRREVSQVEEALEIWHSGLQ